LAYVAIWVFSALLENEYFAPVLIKLKFQPMQNDRLKIWDRLHWSEV
jgi:hypothetical protein